MSNDNQYPGGGIVIALCGGALLWGVIVGALYLIGG